jgi:methyltransferase (TIGR00027 family)
MTITDPISMTARLTAAARARESQRPEPDRLFDDPYAAALAGPEGVAFMEGLEAASRTPGAPAAQNPYIAIRTRFFDDFLIGAVAAASARQLVMVAAGLDSRAFRLDWPQGLRFFELDRPQVLDAKQEILDRAGAQPRCERHLIGVDLLADWAAPLTAAGFDAGAPSVWLIEGLVPYLDEAAAGAVLEQAARLAVTGSRLGADIVGRSMLESPWTRSYIEALARANAPWRFGTEQPEAFLGARGWQATVLRPGDAGVNFGRWPFPSLPRDTPGAPQTFIVTAIRP